MNAPRSPPVVLHASDFQTPSAPVSVPMPFRVTCPPFFPLARQRHAAVGPFTLPWKAAILFSRCGVFSCGVAGFATLCSARRGANGCWQADAVCGRLEEMQRVQQVDELDGCSRAREGEFFDQKSRRPLRLLGNGATARGKVYLSRRLAICRSSSRYAVQQSCNLSVESAKPVLSGGPSGGGATPVLAAPA